MVAWCFFGGVGVVVFFVVHICGGVVLLQWCGVAVMVWCFLCWCFCGGVGVVAFLW